MPRPNNSAIRPPGTTSDVTRPHTIAGRLADSAALRLRHSSACALFHLKQLNKQARRRHRVRRTPLVSTSRRNTWDALPHPNQRQHEPSLGQPQANRPMRGRAPENSSSRSTHHPQSALAICLAELYNRCLDAFGPTAARIWHNPRHSVCQRRRRCAQRTRFSKRLGCQDTDVSPPSGALHFVHVARSRRCMRPTSQVPLGTTLPLPRAARPT